MLNCIPINIIYTKNQPPPLFETVIVNGGKEWISCVGDYQVVVDAIDI
jgi:hypothetical protein